MSTELDTRPGAVPPAAARAAASLGGMTKAAILLVSLGPEKAAKIFSHLNEHEIEAISLEMAKTQRVQPATAAAVATELVETIVAEDYLVQGGVDYAREVLEKSLGGERAREIIGRLSATIERRPFEFLRRTPPEQIAMFLKNETPQTIAVVVANLHTTLAAGVLAELEPAVQADVALRIAVLGETRPEVIQQLEGMVREKLSSLVTQNTTASGGIKPLAEILNHADRSTERNVLDELAKGDPELAEEIRRLLFTFEDIVKLDDRAIQMVLRDVDPKDLAIALRGVTEEVSERIFKNMSARGAEMLREEMEFQPPQKRRAVEEAQGRIVAIVRKLEEAGAIVVSRGGGGDDDIV